MDDKWNLLVLNRRGELSPREMLVSSVSDFEFVDFIFACVSELDEMMVKWLRRCFCDVVLARLAVDQIEFGCK